MSETNFVDNIAELVKVTASFTERRQQLQAKLLQSTMVPYQGGLFKVDNTLLLFVDWEIDRGKTSSIVLDHHLNPITIPDMQNALTVFTQAYDNALSEYQVGLTELKKMRTPTTLAQK